MLLISLLSITIKKDRNENIWVAQVWERNAHAKYNIGIWVQSQTERKEFNAKTLRIFQFGHEIEEMKAEWIKQSGFDLRTVDKQGEQFGFSIADDQIRGHIDGVICAGPVELQYPMLWECKSANDKKFKEFVRVGVTKANQTYAAQIAVYQAYMDLHENPALFTVMNKNTSEIYYELVPFDKALAQKISDKGVQILTATKSSEMLPRIAHNQGLL